MKVGQLVYYISRLAYELVNVVRVAPISAHIIFGSATANVG